MLAAGFELLEMEGRVDTLFNYVRNSLELRRNASDAAPLRCWSTSNTEKKFHVFQNEYQNLAPLSFRDYVGA
jgi:hypothetical protein